MAGRDLSGRVAAVQMTLDLVPEPIRGADSEPLALTLPQAGSPLTLHSRHRAHAHVVLLANT